MEFKIASKMREICIDNFLTKYNPNHFERHSDSSDFEGPCKIPIVASRGGNHKLLSGKTGKKQEVNRINKQVSDTSEIYNDMISNKAKKQIAMDSRRMTNVNVKQYDIEEFTRKNMKNRGEQRFINSIEKENSRSFIANIMPGLSTIFGRRNDKQVSNIEANRKNTNNDYDRTYCAKCERRRIKKINKQHRGYLIQPVYTVEENILRSPLKTNNIILDELVPASKHNNTDISYESVTSEFELENINNYKHKKLLKIIKNKLEKEVRKEYMTYKAVKNEQQQYPSKFQLKPYQVFASSSCQAKCCTSSSESPVKMPSSSSSFWDFFAQKMKSKLQKSGVSKSCNCMKPPAPCSPENCKYIEPTLDSQDYYYNREVPSKASSCLQIDPRSSQFSICSANKNKQDKVICKCYPKKKRKGKNAKSTQQDETKPCQEGHDDITRAIAEKYNGEILCIHNPPCILINGCLNLPPPKSNIQGNLWPVTQSKKSSFVQMCRKMKRNKQKSCEQSSQYHPPCIDLQECLPEFKTEKLIQSICNHDPPCEVVHGCYKVQHDPKLQNSCVHVPMCQNLPECFLFERGKDQKNSCHHSPKCTNVPICSRKYIALTAKEDVGVQVIPRAKMACRHQPQCLMIPRCLAQAIAGDYIPFDAIPGCSHQPCCDLIPACCRKTAKEMVSVPSQYPNGCRIV